MRGICYRSRNVPREHASDRQHTHPAACLALVQRSHQLQRWMSTKNRFVSEIPFAGRLYPTTSATNRPPSAPVYTESTDAPPPNRERRFPPATNRRHSGPCRSRPISAAAAAASTEEWTQPAAVPIPAPPAREGEREQLGWTRSRRGGGVLHRFIQTFMTARLPPYICEWQLTEDICGLISGTAGCAPACGTYRKHSANCPPLPSVCTRRLCSPRIGGNKSHAKHGAEEDTGRHGG